MRTSCDDDPGILAPRLSSNEKQTVSLLYPDSLVKGKSNIPSVIFFYKKTLQLPASVVFNMDFYDIRPILPAFIEKVNK